MIDDTNLAPRNEREIRARFGHRCTINVIHFNTDVQTCLERNAKRTGTARVPDSVIIDMAKKWESWQHEDCSVAKPKYEPIVPGELPAIIVDLDGTLAKNVSGRSPYDWERVGEDALVPEVADIVDAMKKTFVTAVIIMSGRDEVCRQQTEKWLADHAIPFDFLFMRPEGDMRKDSVVKAELFDKHVNGRFEVDFVIDDRMQVHQMWVDRGLFVFNVNQTLEWF